MPTIRSDAELIFQVGEDENFTSLDTILFTATGDWQKYETQSSSIYLEEGYYTIRLLVKKSEHNLNWFELVKITGINNDIIPENKFTLYPNPGTQFTILKVNGENTEHLTVTILDMNGRVMHRFEGAESKYYINTSVYSKGIYIVHIRSKSSICSEKLIIE